MKETFRKELIQTGYVHSPLPLHQEKSLEREREEKPILAKGDLGRHTETSGTQWKRSRCRTGRNGKQRR